MSHQASSQQATGTRTWKPTEVCCGRSRTSGWVVGPAGIVFGVPSHPAGLSSAPSGALWAVLVAFAPVAPATSTAPQTATGTDAGISRLWAVFAEKAEYKF